MDITVADLLKTGALKNARMVAGHQGINNLVKGVTIIEAPDIVNWLSGGELLLTSLYSTPAGSLDYKEYIKKMAEKGVSALAIKIKRFVDAIPQEIIDAGNEFGLPIIEMEASIRYIDIMNPVMAELLNSQVEKLKYFKEVQERFTMLALQCEGMDAIVHTLAELVGNPVAVYDKNNKCLASTDARLDSFTDLKDFSLREELNKKFSYYRQMVKYPGIGEETVSQVIVPIQALGQIRAYLTVAELNSRLAEKDFISLEHAATVVCLDMVKRFAVREVEQKFSNDFLQDIVSGNIDTKIILERASIMDWDLSKPYYTMVFKISNLDQYIYENKDRNLFLQGVKSELVAAITSATKAYTKGCIVGSKGDSFIVLWPTSGESDVVMKSLKKAAQEIQKQVRSIIKTAHIAVGLGNIAWTLEEIPRSFNEAQDAIVIGTRLFDKDLIISFEELGVYRLLSKFEERGVLKEFIPLPLIKLMEYDKENHGDLLETLEVFLENNGNASKAAKELFVHYKTILYRLERIKEITNIDFENKADRLQIELGLKIINFIEKEK
ncbi:MAG: PucR family transcriptional regulator [Peptococcaceae bacterium]|nr:PucR family transcriptional regulator [Peptococcaceae bacterium]